MLAHRHAVNVCAHVILGLPGETPGMMMDTARFISGLPVQGIKIHVLYVTEGTPLADLYRTAEVRCLEREEYVNLVVDFLERIPEGVVVQRLTGDPTASSLLAPFWTLDKARNLRLIQDIFERRDAWQGHLCRKSAAGR